LSQIIAAVDEYSQVKSMHIESTCVRRVAHTDDIKGPKPCQYGK